MSIDMTTLGATRTSANTPAAASKTTVDYQSFLRLLVAEMKNQDPTKPMDSTAYMAQLASFSQVEQSVQTNTKLDNLLQSSTFSQANALIGRTVTSADGKTSGVVESVKLITGGSIAVLKGGAEVTVGAGISIS